RSIIDHNHFIRLLPNLHRIANSANNSPAQSTLLMCGNDERNHRRIKSQMPYRSAVKYFSPGLALSLSKGLPRVTLSQCCAGNIAASLHIHESESASTTPTSRRYKGPPAAIATTPPLTAF